MTSLPKKPLPIILLFGALLFSTVLAWRVFGPNVTAHARSVYFTIAQGEGSSAIAARLEQQHLISSAMLFNAYVLLTGEQGKLQPGVYELSPALPLAAVADKLASGNSLKAKITIQAGWTVQDIADYADKNGIYEKKDFLAAAARDYSGQFDFLQDKPKTASLEGYLFPDTYYVSVQDMPGNFIKIALADFGKQLTPRMRQDIAARRMTIYQTVTMASLIEREASKPGDQRAVAGVLYNRLTAGMPLQVDSTINYLRQIAPTAAKARLVSKQTNSPYNTYRYAGLPKGPIGEPDLSALQAAIYPDGSPYWYYLSTPAGAMIFSKTFQQHQLAIAKYLTQQ